MTASNVIEINAVKGFKSPMSLAVSAAFEGVDVAAEMEAIENFERPILAMGNVKETLGQDLDASKNDVWFVDPRELVVLENFNPRIHNQAYVEHVRSICESIKANGFYRDQPLGGFVQKVGDKRVVFVYAGHSRMAATMLAIAEGTEVAAVPVVIAPKGTTLEDLTFALIAGNNGKPLTFYESAIVVKRLASFNFPEEVIAQRTGLTPLAVTKRLELMGTPIELRQMVAEDKIAATLALEMFAKHGADVLVKLQEAEEQANSEGKTKITAKQANGVTKQMKFVKKSAPRLFEAVTTVQKDPGFQHLSKESQDLLNSLLAEIAKRATDKADKGEEGEERLAA